ncbi:sulfurtransferase [Domibacillus epiphyticus]|uniref:Sulfurtransferase n=1 Tax=Domibacillus epiphyticus TaxID=1714355 RepID=A0A1V2A468_9BACI|nr:sulfurtransferase [Domibacillus epiphyticus]OMP65662.1 sulfurtransferase [Domibacillus epiphyticus]
MIVSTKWLYERLDEKNIIIFDCRFNLANPVEGARLYEKSHIPNAAYAHLDHHLSGQKGKGGRHPLPDVQVWKAFLESRGVSNDSIVVAYDDGVSMFAGRLWWLLKYAGHENAFILDGGFTEWTEKGYPVTTERPIRQSTTYQMNIQNEMAATIEDVKEASEKGTSLLIDSRAPERYLGETEPLDRVPGHIPGAINRFFAEGLDGTKWKAAAQQEARFENIQKDEPVIVYCGSGVSATPNIIALKMAGFQNVKLYPGSYSEWSSDETRPIETEGHDLHGN